MDSANLNQLDWASVPHPGTTVLEYLDVYGWSQRELAKRSGLTPKTISEICNGKAPITPGTALAFEKVLQRPAHFWLNLQRSHDEATARHSALAHQADWQGWVRNFPLKEMKRLRFSLPPGRSDADILLAFFGVSSPSSWNAVWQTSEVAYRQTQRFKTRPECIAAWAREVELTARQVDTAPYDENRARLAIAEIRRLTRKRVEETMEPLQNLCAALGVAVVWVPELPNTGISGCARWISSRKALIGLTLRYKTDDQLWFTFFHEFAHILLHRQRRSFVIDNAADNLSDKVVDPEMRQIENEANEFAADTLIPSDAWTEFVRGSIFTNDSIHDFAETMEIGPGIVVGRLQHDGVLGRHQGNTLKQKLDYRLLDEELP